jgi:hypothetical protein
MDIETINLIKAFFVEQSKSSSGTVIAACLTVGAMLGVAILGAISQWFITKRIVNEEHKRLEIQLKSESKAKRHEKWESDILEAITELLSATDPEVNSEFNPAIITKHVIRAQLLLNNENLLQGKVNALVNELALVVNGWQEGDWTSILRVHGQLSDASKKLIYQPK